ncbi:MAG: carboxypeptidase regulatory-like domain-containing protein, partial [Candidatus Electrothrix sp. ATG1]|nr:carboxypeptidase regulatory-like domain-containing protein [Candidatus Electrothrix sp. ATG1]
MGKRMIQNKKRQTFIISNLLFCFFLLFSNQRISAAPQYELDARAEYNNTLINVQGVVLDQTGQKASGVSVSLQDRVTTTNSRGEYSFSGLNRNNALLEVISSGYQKELIPIALRLPRSITQVSIPQLTLLRDDAENIRFLFGGDTSFARRFLDPSETTPANQIPPDDPNALIQASDPEPGSKAVVQYIRPFYQNADFGVLNF